MSAKLNFLTLFTVCACCASVAATEPIMLAPKWEPGETTYVEFTWENDCVEDGSEVPPPGRTVLSTITLGFLHKVEEVNPYGSVRIKLLLDRVAFRATSDDIDVSYDTDLPPSSDRPATFAATIRSLIGESATLWVAPDGCAYGIKDVAAWYRHTIPDESEPNGRDLMMVSHYFRPTAMEEIWTQFYRNYAFQPVRVGDEWSAFLHAEFSGTLRIIYALERIDHDHWGQVAVVTWRLDEPESSWHEVSGGLLLKSGPDRSRGRSLIQLGGGIRLSSEELVSQRVCVRCVDGEDATAYRSNNACDARHTVLVQSLTERQDAKARVR